LKSENQWDAARSASVVEKAVIHEIERPGRTIDANRSDRRLPPNFHRLSLRRTDDPHLIEYDLTTQEMEADLRSTQAETLASFDRRRPNPIFKEFQPEEEEDQNSKYEAARQRLTERFQTELRRLRFAREARRKAIQIRARGIYNAPIVPAPAPPSITMARPNPFPGVKRVPALTRPLVKTDRMPPPRAAKPAGGARADGDEFAGSEDNDAIEITVTGDDGEVHITVTDEAREGVEEKDGEVHITVTDEVSERVEERGGEVHITVTEEVRERGEEEEAAEVEPKEGGGEREERSPEHENTEEGRADGAVADVIRDTLEDGLVRDENGDGAVADVIRDTLEEGFAREEAGDGGDETVLAEADREEGVADVIRETVGERFAREGDDEGERLGAIDDVIGETVAVQSASDQFESGLSDGTDGVHNPVAGLIGSSFLGGS
jgi:hypothetical protein